MTNIFVFKEFSSHLRSQSIYWSCFNDVFVCSWWSEESGFGDKLPDWTSDSRIFCIPPRCYGAFSKQLEVHNNIITKQMNRAGKSWQIGIFPAEITIFSHKYFQNSGKSCLELRQISLHGTCHELIMLMLG